MAMTPLAACARCGQINRLPSLRPGDTALCARCRHAVHPEVDGAVRARLTAGAAAGALLLYVPAMLLPVLRMDRLGFHNESSILVGTVSLLQHGNWFVGTVVMLFSIVLPLVKLLLLLELSTLRLLGPGAKSRVYRVLEHAGRWSMMDVMLLAFLVMLVKLGALAEFHFGPGVIAFVACVVMSITASAAFDPRVIWRDDP
jgi:paraquat-inducible protein A